MKDVKPSVGGGSTGRLFFILSGSILVSDLLVTFVLETLPHSVRDRALLEPALLSVLLFPLLYFGVFRQLMVLTTERKRAEVELRESESKFRSLFDSSRDAIMTLEPPSWKFTSCNPATVALFRASNERHFVSLGPWAVSPERQPDGRASVEKAREMIETAMREGSHFFEWTHQRIAGEAFPATVLLSRMNLAGHVFLQATVRDISEIKRAEETLREREYLLSESQRLGHVGSWLYEVAGRTAWSEEMYRLYGVSPDRFTPTAESFVSLIHPDDRPAMQSWMAACAAGERPGELAFRINMPDGRIRFLLGRGDAVPGHGGGLVRMAGTAQDVTERKLADAALRESAEHYRSVAGSANDAIVTADGAGNIVDWNPSAERMFGRSETEVCGQPLTVLMPPRYCDLHRRGIERVQAGGEPHVIGKTVQLEGLRKDGSEFPIELSLAEWKAISGQFFTAIIHDITARKRTEAERETLIAELQEALANVKSLGGLLPICAGCKKIRDDLGYWSQVEAYIGKHTDARFTHGICPECIKKYYPDLDEDVSSDRSEAP